MKRPRLAIIVLIVLCCSLFLSGCWDYREIDEMAIVAGVAIDKGHEKKFEVTVEIVKASGGRQSTTQSLIQSAEGDTIFDTVRNLISISGKKLYWSHSKIIIVSQEVAKDGLVSILDWYNRDAETRGDTYIAISKEKTAKEIFSSEDNMEDIKSFVIAEMLKNEKNLSKSPETQIWEIVDNLKTDGISPIAPTIQMKEVNKKKVFSVQGTALFSSDKLIGFLDEKDTRSLLYLRDEVKGGIVVCEPEGEKGKTLVTLEIFKSKTKVNPVISGDQAEFTVEIEMDLGIDEIEGTENFMDKEKTAKLENDICRLLKNQIEDFVRKTQSEMTSDIPGFGSKIMQDDPEKWEKIFKQDWKNKFKEIKVSVTPKVNVRSSALMSKAIKIGD